MARFEKIRYQYLYSSFVPKDRNFFKFDYHAPDAQKHTHTCIAVRVMPEEREIHYAISRRESPGKLIRLKHRINQIRELGGIVPEHMTQAVHHYSHNFSKKKAREVACMRLNNKPHVIQNVDISTLNAHTITRMVMESIVSDEQFEFSPETSTAAEGAAEWLLKHVEEYRDTIPNLQVAKDLLGLLDTMNQVLALAPVLDSDVPFGMVDEEKWQQAMATGPTCLPIMPKKANPA